MSNWIKIERDSDGFATDECLEQMACSLPIVVTQVDLDDGEIFNIEYFDAFGWEGGGSIERHPYYTHYLPITLPKI